MKSCPTAVTIIAGVRILPKQLSMNHAIVSTDQPCACCTLVWHSKAKLMPTDVNIDFVPVICSHWGVLAELTPEFGGRATQVVSSEFLFPRVLPSLWVKRQI